MPYSFDFLKQLCIRRLFPILLASVAPGFFSSASFGQEVALKTNMLYIATTTPNIGVEVGIGNNNTVNLFYGLNPWKFSSDFHGQRYAKHWLLMPEYRWWQCTIMNGHFIGVHALGGQMNVSNVNIPLPGFFFSGVNVSKAARDSRYQGWYAGAGFTYGYQYMLSRHWNLEGEIGVGYAHAWTDQYPCGDCGTRIRKCNSNYLGLTKLGLSIMYVF